MKAEWDYDDVGARKLEEDIERAKRKANTATDQMVSGNLRLARSALSTGVAFASLGGIISTVASGQGNLIQMIPQLIGYLISLAASIYTVVGAEKARALASAIANVATNPFLAPILIAGIVAAGAAVGAALALGSRQRGGDIYRRGSYLLHPGERVLRADQGGNIINFNGPITRESVPLIRSEILNLRAMGVI